MNIQCVEDGVEWDETTGCYVKKKRKDEPQWPYGVKCECGVASLGYKLGHSDWCPLAKREIK